MSSLPYFKMYPRDFFEGTAMMEGELKGTYSLLLSLIYMHRGRLPDDARYISGHLGYSVRKWNKLRSELINWGKIKAENNIISNLRADKEEIILRSYQDKQAENARAPNKNKDLQKPPLNQSESEPKSYTTLLGAREFDLYDAAGNEDPRLALNLSEPLNWLANGCDFDLDIIPGVKHMATKGKITNWQYCRGRVFQNRDTRLAPAPATNIQNQPRNATGGDIARQMAEQLRAVGE